MISVTNRASILIEKLELKNVTAIEGRSFIDVEAILQHIRKKLPPLRIAQSYSYRDDVKISIQPREHCIIRPYQMKVVNALADSSKTLLNPTLVVMPCGSGKTFTSLCAIAQIRRRCLVITNYKIIARQWKKELIKNFEVCEENIQCISDDNFDLQKAADITIITYDTLSSVASSKSRSNLASILTTQFTTIILDEAHKSVAPSYFDIITRLSGKFIAFTATPIREDSEMKRIQQLVCNEIEIEAQELIKDGYLAEIKCKTVFLPTNPLFYSHNLSHSQQISRAVINPNKTAYLKILLTESVKKKQRVLIFCDDIWSMHFVYKQLKYAFNIIGPVYMGTTMKERENAVERFIEADDCAKIMMISRTGDEGLDVPCATRLIQICTPWGSRRQHAQRIGRVQRPFNTDDVCEAITLVSQNTVEVSFAKKRDEYLKKFGYNVSEDYVNSQIECDYKKLLSILKNKKNASPVKMKKKYQRIPPKKPNALVMKIRKASKSKLRVL